MNRLQGKRALITGGSSGIGLQTARSFLNEGARVAITGSNPDILARAAAELGGDVVAIRGDAGNIERQAGMAREVRQAFGGLDALFINAGVAEFKPVDTWDEAGFDRSFAVNVTGPFFLIQALLPDLANPASIILNTSINAHIGMPGSSVYSATKGALLSMARTLSGELIGRGIRVNAISPGPIATSLHDRAGLVGDVLENLIRQVPLGRRGRPEEIAQAVVFLASDEGAFAVGSEFIIDGGMSNL